LTIPGLITADGLEEELDTALFEQRENLMSNGSVVNNFS